MIVNANKTNVDIVINNMENARFTDFFVAKIVQVERNTKILFFYFRDGAYLRFFCGKDTVNFYATQLQYVFFENKKKRLPKNSLFYIYVEISLLFNKRSSQ